MRNSIKFTLMLLLFSVAFAMGRTISYDRVLDIASSSIESIESRRQVEPEVKESTLIPENYIFDGGVLSTLYVCAQKSDNQVDPSPKINSQPKEEYLEGLGDLELLETPTAMIDVDPVKSIEFNLEKARV